jgi:hypothetical protein
MAPGDSWPGLLLPFDFCYLPFALLFIRGIRDQGFGTPGWLLFDLSLAISPAKRKSKGKYQKAKVLRPRTRFVFFDSEWTAQR